MLPSHGDSHPVSSCSWVNPSFLPTLMGNLPFGWWKMAWAKSLGSSPALSIIPLAEFMLWRK